MIKCKLCGKEFKAVSWKHLHFKHGLTVAEYEAAGHKTGIGAKLKGHPNLALTGRKFPGRKNSGQFLKGIVPWNKGKEMPPEYGEKVSRAMYATLGAIRYGSDNTSWKGGITPENQKLRHSQEYTKWRDAVFKRDNYTCQIYGQVGGRLVAHHVKSYANYPSLRYEVENGIALCQSFHSSLHNNATFRFRYGYLLGVKAELYEQLDLF